MNLISLSAPLKLSSWCIIRGGGPTNNKMTLRCKKISICFIFFTKYRKKGERIRPTHIPLWKYFFLIHHNLLYLTFLIIIKYEKELLMMSIILTRLATSTFLIFLKRSFVFLFFYSLWIILIDVLTTISYIRNIHKNQEIHQLLPNATT
jgi:hypothetical protein